MQVGGITSPQISIQGSNHVGERGVNGFFMIPKPPWQPKMNIKLLWL